MARRRQPEFKIHTAVCEHLRLRAKPDVLWLHPPNGGRRDVREAANLKRMGVLAGRGWIGRTEIESALFQAATACGLVRDTGARKVRKTIASGIDAGLAHPHRDLSATHFTKAIS
jgi:hypothetical protein